MLRRIRAGFAGATVAFSFPLLGGAAWAAGTQQQEPSLGCKTVTQAEAAQLLGTTGHIRMVPNSFGCVYATRRHMYLGVDIAPDEKSILRALSLSAIVNRAGPEHVLTVEGVSGYWRSVTGGGESPGTLVVLPNSGSVLAAEVRGTTATRSRAIQAVKDLLEQD
jgi:hypothetical protein